MKRIHIVGRKNSGKTTLVVDLVKHLTAQGYLVGTIKHTHHRHELDTPGKDSHQHREAGAVAVGILSPAMDAVFLPNRAAQDLAQGHAQSDIDGDNARYHRLDSLFADCDLVLVEGHSQCEGTRLEVWRAINETEPIAAADEDMVALITDDPIVLEIPIWSRSDVAQLADNILDLAGIKRR